MSLARPRSFPCGNASCDCGTFTIPLDVHQWNGVGASRISGDSGFVVSHIGGFPHLYDCLVVWCRLVASQLTVLLIVLRCGINRAFKVNCGIYFVGHIFSSLVLVGIHILNGLSTVFPGV